MYSQSSLHKSAAFIVLTAFAFAVHAQDGSYDPTFGNGGKTWIDVTSSTADVGARLIRLPNGNFFMAGECGIPCAAWLTPGGALASGYGTSGTGTASFSDFTGWPSDALQALDAAAFADGSLAVITNKSVSSSYIARLAANGSGLDPSVGNGAGFVSTPFPAVLVRVTAQQQVIVVGLTTASPTAIVVARYDSTFHLDASFGTSGSTTIGFADGSAFPNGMTLQRDGKVVVISSVSGSPAALGIVRLTAGGAPDPNFGIDSDGRFESTFGSAYGSLGNDIVEDKKGRLVFAGLTLNGDNPLDSSGEWLVDRVLSGGATDPSFNGGQPQEFTINDSSTTYEPQACCVTLQSDNRIVVAGTMDRAVPGEKYFAIARFLEDGTPDSSFGGGGQSYGDMSPEAPNVITDMTYSMVIVPGGIVVGGFTEVKSNEIRFSAAKERIDLLFADDFE